VDSLTNGSQKCIHFWVIDSPDGPTSLGQCKYCHEERLFKNTLPERKWREDSTQRFMRDPSYLSRPGPGEMQNGHLNE